MDVIKSLSADEIVEIASAASGPSVSIYLPTLRKGHEVIQASIELKNLLRDAENELAEQGLKADDIQSLTADAHDLVSQREYWQHQGDGLAIFLNANYSKVIKLPIGVPSRQVVSESFDITPLLSMLSSSDRFFVLALSANEVRLFDATQFRFDEVLIEDVPQGMSEALHADDNERQLQFHSGAGASPKGGGRSATLLDGEVHGNQEKTSLEDIHRAAWEIVASHVEETHNATLARFHELLGTGLASAQMLEVSSGAVDGRVDTLFVSQDLTNDQVNELNRTAIETIQKGGKVLALPSSQMPTDQPMAATFRY